jgi:hypothetical protein
MDLMDVDCPWQDRLLNKSKLATYKMITTRIAWKCLEGLLFLNMFALVCHRFLAVYGFVAYKGAQETAHDSGQATR